MNVTYDVISLVTVNQTITMVFSKEDKILTRSLYETKGYGARKLFKEFPQKNWTKGGLDSLITKLRSTGDIVRKQGIGRPRSTRTNEALAEVAALVLSQVDKPQTHTAQVVKFPVKLGFLAQL